jgi:hypothetical protein
VRFYSRGRDDQRDLPTHPSGLRPVKFSARYAWRAGSADNPLSNQTMPFSVDTTAIQGNFHLPTGEPWLGWVNGWGDVDRFPGLCPFDFVYYSAAVDENDKRDGTPDSLAFYVSGSPQFDSLFAPLVLVLAPVCSAGLSPFCPSLDSLSFGPDTMLVVAEHVRDPAVPPAPPTTPLGLGSNRFKLPMRGWAHDWPRDNNQYIRAELWGRIRAWLFNFDCTDSTCAGVNVPGGGQWREDRYEPQVFDDTLQVTFVLDTLCVSGAVPCVPSFDNVKAVLPPSSSGTYHFTLQSRDTSPNAPECFEPSDLGPRPSPFPRPTADYGRKTVTESRTVVLRQLQEVRPYVVAPAARTASRPARKAWWKR